MGWVLYMGLPDIEKMSGFVRFFNLLGFVGILHDTGKMFSFVKLRHGRALYTEIIQVFGGSTRRAAQKCACVCPGIG